MKQGFIAVVMVAMLTSCAAYKNGRDCNVDVAATEIAVAQGYVTNYQLYRDGVIDKEAAKKALKALDVANAAVENADSLCQLKNPKAADYILQAAKALAEFTAITGAK